MQAFVLPRPVSAGRTGEVGAVTTTFSELDAQQAAPSGRATLVQEGEARPRLTERLLKRVIL
jgi:hypothetical protein